MSERSPVLVHGATGYTGRLVCAALQRRGLRFAISGRNREKLQTLSRELGGVDWHVVDVTQPESLRAAVEGRTIVCACAGPFMQVGESLLASCARMGVHYVDTTGEQSFVADVFSRYRATAEASGACVVPSMAFETAPSDWAAHEAAIHAGGEPDEIAIVYMLYSRHGYVASTTQGTKRSAVLAMGDRNPRQFVNGALVHEPLGKEVRSFSARSGQRTTALSFPSVEAVLVPTHTQAKTVRTFVGAGRRTARLAQASSAILPPLARFFRGALLKAVSLHGSGLQRGVEGSRKADGAGEDEQRRTSFDILAEARRGSAIARVFVAGHDPYGLTAEIQAYAAEQALSGKIKARGVVAPSVAFPPEEAFAALRPFGLDIYRLEPGR